MITIFEKRWIELGRFRFWAGGYKVWKAAFPDGHPIRKGAPLRGGRGLPG